MFRSKATAYGILAAAEIARQTKGDGKSALMTAEIAEAYDLPKAYVGTILSQLTKARWGVLPVLGHSTVRRGSV